MAKQIEFKDDDGNLIFRINKEKKTGKYYPVHAEKQIEYLEGAITLDGFDKLPVGFYKSGFGLTLAGNFILQEIYTRYKKKIKLTVSNKKTSQLNLRGKTIILNLSGELLGNLGSKLRAIKRERNAEMLLEARNSMGSQFAQLRELKNSKIGYIPGKVAETLSIDKIINGLNVEDRQALEDFIPAYLESIPGTLRSKKKLKVIYDALDAGKKIYLDKVLKEFRTKLKNRVQNESIWQKFLSEYILLLRHNYGEVLEKESVSLQGKFPDFMLVDPYGYLDIYEIKKPATSLLKLDASRNNYYWDVEISKAIAQVENYIHQIQRHADTLMNDIRKSKNIDVNIVRPRGYIIAGLRTQLTSAKMKDDFRILCDSLKNVDVILYDDVLESLEAFVNRSTNN